MIKQFLSFFSIFGLLIACAPSLKEYKESEVKYDESKNVWRLVSDGSVIHEGFVLTGGTIKDSPSQSKVMVDENGKVKSISTYVDGVKIIEKDYSKSPKQIISVVYESCPENTSGETYEVTSLNTDIGDVCFFKHQSGDISEIQIIGNDRQLKRVYRWREDGVRLIPWADNFDVEVLFSGYYEDPFESTYTPWVELQFRNMTEKTFKQNVDVLYTFVRGDEVIDSGTETIYNESGWPPLQTKKVDIFTKASVVHPSQSPVGVRISLPDNSIVFSRMLPLRIEPFDYDD